MITTQTLKTRQNQLNHQIPKYIKISKLFKCLPSMNQKTFKKQNTLIQLISFFPPLLSTLD